ncbi:hypothetical protein [Paracoccus sp. Ld10]|uniref:hypothetical protein n=1 Tax=Paracoccus sp. Ld10 TaxID=649158 RepID=UPI00386CEF54
MSLKPKFCELPQALDETVMRLPPDAPHSPGAEPRFQFPRTRGGDQAPNARLVAAGSRGKQALAAALARTERDSLGRLAAWDSAIAVRVRLIRIGSRMLPDT